MIILKNPEINEEHNIWVTSDCHFGHLNILKYCPETRPFATIEEHDQAIVDNWNSVVKDGDDVIVVGDFFMGPVENIDRILPHLKGEILLIPGNHDSNKRIAKFEEYGVNVLDDDKLFIKYNGVVFELNHMPPTEKRMKCGLADAGSKEFVYCYGHVHDCAPRGYIDNSFHVGVDTNDLTPVSLNYIWRQKVISDMEEKCGDVAEG